MTLQSDIPNELLQPSENWEYPDICITVKERFIRSISTSAWINNNIIVASGIAILMLFASVKYGNNISTLIFSFGTIALIVAHARKNIFYTPNYFRSQYIRTLPRYEMYNNSLSPRYYSEFNHNGNIKTFYYEGFISANENDDFILEIDSNNMIRGCRKITTISQPNVDSGNPQE